MVLAVLTGAYGVFGTHMAEGLLAAGVATICIVRDEVKAQTLVSGLHRKYPNVPCSYRLCDVSDHEEIKKLAASFSDTPIDILINNAAITPTTRTETKKGIEQQWACNVLGYHWMIKELMPNLLRSEKNPARVINIASFYASGLNLDDVEFKKRRYDPDSAYQASKQANRMMTRGWAQRLDPEKVVVFSCHPGVATSAVSLGLGFDLDRSEAAAKAGATTALFLALDPNVCPRTGNYFHDSQEEHCQYCTNGEAVAKLFNLMESYP